MRDTSSAALTICPSVFSSPRMYSADSKLPSHFLHGMHGSFGRALNLLDGGGDVGGAAGGALREFAHFVCYHGEAAPLLAGTRRFDGRISASRLV